MGHLSRDAAVSSLAGDGFGRSSEVFEIERPGAAWDWMRQTGQAPQGADWVRPQVLDAWARCIDDYHLPPERDFAPRMGSRSSARPIEPGKQSLRDAFAAGLPLMVYNLRPFLEEGNVSILLTDPHGRIVHLLDAGLRILSAGQNLARLGVDWSESSIGNNGVGTACLLNEPVAFDGKEHFSRALHPFATAGCPVLGLDGRACATIGMVTDRRDTAKLMLGFLRITCQLLEARLFERLCRSGYLLRLRHGNGADPLAEQSTLIDGKILVSPNGAIKGANRSAIDLLGVVDVVSIIGKPLGAVLGVGLTEVIGRDEAAGVRYLKAGLGERQIRLEALRLDDAAEKPRMCARNFDAHGAKAWRDHVIDAALQKASVLQQREISLLITGESGVGKDHLVRSLHASGPRKDRPLVAINCAAIPRELIESELFGYEGGSFTGARAKGKKGKFVEANGGILFLDEIGDMALDLQATLLRVLDSSEVVPIGSHRPIKIDVRVVAATNCPLREMVKEGRFRRDLYYRLNGVQISLPPLRERPDRLQLLEHLLVCEQGSTEERKELSDEVRNLFLRHPWPGNVREAKNILRSAVAVSRYHDIRLDDLPRDFIEEAETESSLRGWNPPGGSAHSAPQRRKIALADWEEQAIRTALTESEGNIAKAARRLGITRATLYNKMERYSMRSFRRACSNGGIP